MSDPKKHSQYYLDYIRMTRDLIRMRRDGASEDEEEELLCRMDKAWYGMSSEEIEEFSRVTPETFVDTYCECAGPPDVDDSCPIHGRYEDERESD